MMANYKKKVVERDMPKEFDQATINTITRIEGNSNVMGIMYFNRNFLQFCTVPENMTQYLSNQLPPLTLKFRRAIAEMNVLDELVTFRIMTNKIEIIVADGKEFTACVLQKIFKKKHRKTASLNQINPIVDRIMEDDSVEGVIMTNHEGIPILTNINLIGANNYGRAMHRLGYMTHLGVKEIDPFDEVLILRLKTKKLEMMVAPHVKFNIIVMQHSRASRRIVKQTKVKQKSS